MKIGRIVLTHRQDLVLPIKNFYLGSRTDFLVIGCNKTTVHTSQFQQSNNFKVFDYIGKGLQGSLSGHQFIAWVGVAKKFPDIDAWVVHDYDLLVKVHDRKLFSYVPTRCFGCIGLPFPNWQPGLPSPTVNDVFPFSRHCVSKDDQLNFYFRCLKESLMQDFPIIINGVRTIMSGYSDLLAIYRDDLLKLDNPRLLQMPIGIEQVPHTVFRYHGVQPVDFRSFFSINISLENIFYVPFKNRFDISHPVKFWPNITRPTFTMWLKRLIKLFLGQGGYSKSLPPYIEKLRI